MTGPPSPGARRSRSELVTSVLARTERIAVVGASPDPSRPSYGVMRRLLSAGFEVVPVNPMADEVLGLATVPSLADVEGHIDLVDVFRRAEHAPSVAQEAVEVGAKALWLQSGIVSPEARRIAHEGGLDYIEDACLAVEVALSGAGPAGS